MVLPMCLLLLGTAVALPEPAEPPVASLTQVTGEVMVRHGQDWMRAEQVPIDLASGDTVSTDRGRAEVHFKRDDSTLVLDVGTHLVISESDSGVAGNALRRVEILLGDVWFKMQKSVGMKTELATPTAVGGLRGTEGNVHVENETHSWFTLAEGQLEVAKRSSPTGGLTSETQILNAGHVLHAHRNNPLEVRPATKTPARPNLKVAPKDLPKPPKNWRQSIQPAYRPPAMHKDKAAPGVKPSRERRAKGAKSFAGKADARANRAHGNSGSAASGPPDPDVP